MDPMPSTRRSARGRTQAPGRPTPGVGTSAQGRSPGPWRCWPRAHSFATLTGVAGADQVATSSHRRSSGPAAHRRTTRRRRVPAAVRGRCRSQHRGRGGDRRLNQLDHPDAPAGSCRARTTARLRGGQGLHGCGQDTSGISELFSTDQNSALASSSTGRALLVTSAVTIAQQLRTSQRRPRPDQSGTAGPRAS